MAEEKKVKARLVCRGFEELVKVQADSPTASKETLHMLLAIAATKGWTIKSGDIKNAYLQGEHLDRDIYMEPPPEQKKCGKIWKLKKAVYGMNDAGRKWYFKVEETLNRLGCTKSWRLVTLKRRDGENGVRRVEICEQRQGGNQRETEGRRKRYQCYSTVIDLM